MWLVGVVVRRYIDFHIIIITYLYSTCISSFFWHQHPYFFVHLLNVFYFMFMLYIFVQYSKLCSKNIRDRSKIKITRTWRYNCIDKNVHRLRVHASNETSMCEVLPDVSRKLPLVSSKVLILRQRRQLFVNNIVLILRKRSHLLVCNTVLIQGQTGQLFIINNTYLETKMEVAE